MALPSPEELFGALIEEVRFALDSPLEGGRFELSVPLPKKPASAAEDEQIKPVGAVGLARADVLSQ
jgi:hypothetical protein